MNAAPRRDGPFVPVNCGAIPTELMESELFGHKRGSFTGAVSRQEGTDPVGRGRHAVSRRDRRPAAAHAGQAAAGDPGEGRAAGRRAARRSRSTCAILSATHKNLAALVAEGKFREDLFYRINVIEMRVPALRERPEDVPELAECRAAPAVTAHEASRRRALADDALAALETLRASPATCANWRTSSNVPSP